MSTQYDYIIIGQGLAGATLAHSFLLQGQSVLVADEERPVTASKVAAGIWNPMVFKRYTVSWLAEKLIAFNSRFYPEMEEKLGAKFYHPLPYYKIFASEDDVTHWVKKLYNSEVSNFLPPEIYNGLPETFIAPHGAAAVNHCGYLDVAKYISASATHFKTNGGFLNERFDYDALIMTAQGVSYKGFTAKKIIFCEGQYARNNPYWPGLPFNHAKGEIFTIHAPQLQTGDIVSKGIFILPLGDDMYKVGSTYYWDDEDEMPTTRGHDELTQKLAQLINTHYKIIGHTAALRPTITDRRPIIGLHPQDENIGIFNGLGTRGVLLAPYFARHFTEHILDDEALHKAVDVRRFM